MISYSNTSKLLFSQSQTKAMSVKPKSSQGASDSAFKSVFENTVGGNSRTTNDRNVSKRNNVVSQNSEAKAKYKSFREVAKDTSTNPTQSSVKNTSDDVSTKDVDSITEKLQDDTEKVDDVVNVLAMMLGIQPNELVKIANELGFTAEDLNNADKLSQFMAKLSDVLELSASQKAVMDILAVEIPKQVSSENNEVVPDLETAKADGSEIKADSTNSIKTVDLSDISKDIKAQLDQLIKNAEVSQEPVSSEISKAIEAMKAQAKVVPNVSTEQVDSETDINADVISVKEDTSKNVVENKAEKEAAKLNNAKSNEKSESSVNEATAEPEIQAVNNQIGANSTQNQQPNEQNMQAFADIKINALNNQTQVQKAEFSMPQPVRTSEVINQVVEQAKVVLGQDKSEMIIHLKPDHLGKLELKVVTEQGIVAAKFIAESNQVKEIIETNMQLLKDSLEKQGLSIDNVSVQVGQEKQNEFRQQNSYQGSNRNSNNNRFDSSEVNTVRSVYNAFDTLPERLAQYTDDLNTINFTA